MKGGVSIIEIIIKLNLNEVISIIAAVSPMLAEWQKNRAE